MWWIRLDNLDEEEICGREKEILERVDIERTMDFRDGNRIRMIELKVVDHRSIRSKKATGESFSNDIQITFSSSHTLVAASH